MLRKSICILMPYMSGICHSFIMHIVIGGGGLQIWMEVMLEQWRSFSRVHLIIIFNVTYFCETSRERQMQKFT